MTRPRRSWSARWKDCLGAAAGRRASAPPGCAATSTRFDALREDIAFVDGPDRARCSPTAAGQILTCAARRLDDPGRQRSPRTRCPSSASRRRNTSTRPPASHPASLSSPRPSDAAAASRAPDLPEHRDALIGHRLGPRPARTRLPAAVCEELSASAAKHRHRSARRDRAPRLPALLAHSSRTQQHLRRSALRSREARPRAVTASDRYAARRRNLACRPPALAGLNGAKRKPAARRRLISLPT